jgi:sphingosine kinase
LMVDLDIGTENIRWLGDTRFILGFLRGVVTNKTRNTRLSLKVEADDKVEMARFARQKAGDVRGRKVGGGTDPLHVENGMKGLAVGDKDERGAKGSKGSSGEDRAGNEHQLQGSARSESESENGQLPLLDPLRPDDTWLTIESGSKGSNTSGSKRDSALVQDELRRGAWVHGQGIMYT